MPRLAIDMSSKTLGTGLLWSLREDCVNTVKLAHCVIPAPAGSARSWSTTACRAWPGAPVAR